MVGPSSSAVSVAASTATAPLGSNEQAAASTTAAPTTTRAIHRRGMARGYARALVAGNTACR